MKGSSLQWVLLGVSLGVSLGPLVGFPQDSRPVEVLEAETAAHRIGDRGPIYTNLGHEPFAAAFEVVVGPDGKVMSAQTSNGFISDLTALCKTWRVKPFERNGQPGGAPVRQSVHLLSVRPPAGGNVPFPPNHG